MGAVAVLRPHDCLPRHRRKRNPRSSIPPDSSPNLVIGQVKILRRGELLPPSPLDATDPVLPLPPMEPAMEQVQRGGGFYAGSAAFVASPPPSSLPLPGFFSKRVGGGGGFPACDTATSDLRRILRLD